MRARLAKVTSRININAIVTKLLSNEAGLYNKSCFYRQKQEMKIEKLQMTKRSGLRKSTYFEKYRQELSRISTQIEKETLKSSTLITLSRMSNQSQELSDRRPQPPQSQTQFRNTLPEQLLTPPLLGRPRPQFAVQSPTATDPSNSPATRKISGGQFSIKPISSTYPRKVSQFLNNSSERSKQEASMYQRQDFSHVRKDSGVSRQMETMGKQHESLRTMLERKEVEIEQKKQLLKLLKAQIAQTAEPDYMKNIVSYAERIITIEQKIREAKNTHEELLNDLTRQKTELHSKNVELSKQIEHQQEEIQILKIQYQVVDLDSPNKHLERITSKLLSDISRLEAELAVAEDRRNNAQQLEQLGQNEFNKYKQAWIKKFIGKQIAMAEERIKFRGDSDSVVKRLQKKRWQLREKKVEVMLSKKRLLECCKVIDSLQKTINQKKEQIKKIANSERKISVFNIL